MATTDNIFEELIEDKVRLCFKKHMEKITNEYQKNLEGMLEQVVKKFQKSVIDDRIQKIVAEVSKKRFDHDLSAYTSLSEKVVASNNLNSDLICNTLFNKIDELKIKQDNFDKKLKSILK